jgi:hypothetical protein
VDRCDTRARVAAAERPNGGCVRVRVELLVDVGARVCPARGCGRVRSSRAITSRPRCGNEAGRPRVKLLCSRLRSAALTARGSRNLNPPAAHGHGHVASSPAGIDRRFCCVRALQPGALLSRAGAIDRRRVSAKPRHRGSVSYMLHEYGYGYPI